MSYLETQEEPRVCFVQGDCSVQDHTNNRHSRLAPELTPCDVDVRDEFIAVIESGDMNEMIFFFEWCVHNSIHIVGSRNYVYKSDSVLSMLNQIKQGIFINPSLFTRTLGLRSFCIGFIVDNS